VGALNEASVRLHEDLGGNPLSGKTVVRPTSESKMMSMSLCFLAGALSLNLKHKPGAWKLTRPARKPYTRGVA